MGPIYQSSDARRIYLPSYPKAFIHSARLSRERDRVFLAMPFDAKHSETLWRIIQGVCTIRGLNVQRADSSVYPNPIVADILEEIERAEIIIADLTDLNPNVLYELGIAHVRCDSVILLCKQGQQLPFDLAFIRCIFYDLSNRDGLIAFSERLGKTLDALKSVGPPIVIESILERTKLLISDLQKLAILPDEELSNETVWFSGFLSPYAISKEEPFKPEEAEYRKALFEEKKSMLSLARRGCQVRCIITPPSPEALNPARLDIAHQRLNCLLRFLKSRDIALKNIEWAVSPFRQKSLYIIGHLSTFEGYKKGIQRAFSLTLRQTVLDVITANISMYEVLFDRLATYTLTTYSGHGEDDRRDALRLATIRCLENAVEYLLTIEKQK